MAAEEPDARSDTGPVRRFSGFAKLSLACPIVALLLLLLYNRACLYSFHRHGVNSPVARAEYVVLWTVVGITAIGSLLGLIACFVVKASKGRLWGVWWAVAGAIVNAGVCCGVLFDMWTQWLWSSMAT